MQNTDIVKKTKAEFFSINNFNNSKAINTDEKVLQKHSVSSLN